MEERRVEVRHKSFIQGRILFNHRRSSMDCVIRDFTKQGGRLEFSEVAAVPDTFEIYVPSKDQYFVARAIWHKGNSIGVKWTSEDALHPAPEIERSADPLAERVARLEQEVAILRRRLDALQR